MHFVALTLARVEETKLNRNASPHVLLYELLAGTNSLAQYVVEYALGKPKSAIARYVPMALPARIYSEDVASGRAFTSRILASGYPELGHRWYCLGQVLGNSSLGEYEFDTLKGFLSSDDEHEVATAAGELCHVGALDAAKALKARRSHEFLWFRACCRRGPLPL